MKCELFIREGVGPRSPYRLLASYGNAEQFNFALPGLLGDLTQLRGFNRVKTGNDADDFYELITIDRLNGMGNIRRTVYKLVGYIPE